MITVAGEALIDLVLDHDGCVGAQPGGGPFNTARTIGRLGLAPAFLGRLSSDGFGRLLRASLDQDGVRLSVPDLSTLPPRSPLSRSIPKGRRTTASTSRAPHRRPGVQPARGRPAGRGDRAARWQPGADDGAGRRQRRAPDHRRAATGHAGDGRSELPARRRSVITVLTAPGSPGYCAAPTSSRSAGKTSPISTRTSPAQVAAARLLDLGPHLILMTDGPRPARALLPGQQVTVEVPPVDVVDTIGAGDAFGGGFLAWWTRSELTRRDLHRIGEVREALLAAAQVAALTCTRVGAEPPWLAEVEERPGWRSRLAG